MKIVKQLLFFLPFFSSPFLAFAQVDWEMNEGLGILPFDPAELFEILGNSHGGSGGFEYAHIPDFLDPNWELAPVDAKGDLFFSTNSVLAGFMTGLDFTYFRTTFSIEGPSNPLFIRFNEVDDGVRAYVFNSNFPYAIPLNIEDTYIPGGDARIYTPVTQTDISPLLVQGENTIILVQFDDSRTNNYLSVSLIGEEKLNSCGRDIKGPDIFAVLENGSEILLSNLTFDAPFECETAPSLDLIVRDNCDRDAFISNIVGGVESVNEDGLTTYSLSYTAKDASGNQSVFSYAYAVQADQESPSIEVATEDIPVFILDLCDEYTLSLEDLNLSITDNCTPQDAIQVALSQTAFQGAGTTEVTVIATDTLGNQSALDIKINLEPDPNFIIITAGDDVLHKTLSEDGSILLTEEELIANDAASDDSALEIQDLRLVNPEDGTLIDNRDGTYTFTPSEDFSGTLELTYFAKSKNATLYFSETGHYYEYVSFESITWENAKAAAAARQINGINGYLATITSQAENEFIFERLEGNGWIGASDAAVEGEWRWVTGPEGKIDNGEGLFFWKGNGLTGVAVENRYSNWGQSRSAATEPNDLGDEDYAYFIFRLSQFFDEQEAGRWNDFRGDNRLIDGYLVEYGGDEDCAPSFTDEANVNVTIIINSNDFPDIEDLYYNSNQSTLIKVISVHPNPFREQTNLQFHLSRISDIDISIHDINGRIIQHERYDDTEAGQHNFAIELEQFEQGVYFISVSTASTQQTIKVVVMK